MITASEMLFEDARAALVQKVATVCGQSNLEEAFAAWLLPEPIPGISIAGSTRLATAHTGAERSHRDVAILGYAAAMHSIEDDQRIALLTGLRWLAGREPFVYGSPMPFCMDAVALLGIALGARSLEEEATQRAIGNWMGKFISSSYGMLTGWQKCLLAAVQKHLGFSAALQVPSEQAFADVRVALRSKGLLPEPIQAEEDERQTLLLIKAGPNSSLSAVQATLRLAAFDWVRRPVPVLSPNRITASQVADLLRRIPFALRRWTWEDVPRTARKDAKARKWYVDNEYHVQNLLWTILAPIFPELQDEEYVAGVGPLHPRTDICIASLNLIVEAKFMRVNMSPRDLIEEIAADASLYLAGSSIYNKIIVFIWDDARRSEQHTFMVEGLKKLKGVLDAVVVSRPGIMREGTQSEPHPNEQRRHRE